MCITVRREKFLTLPEAADALKVSRMTVYRWALQGMTANGEKLKVLKDRKTRHYLVSEASIRRIARMYHPGSVHRFELVTAD